MPDIIHSACACKVVNDAGRFHLPPENMDPDCPMHGTKAAKALGIGRDNLRYRVKKYRIERPREA